MPSSNGAGSSRKRRKEKSGGVSVVGTVLQVGATLVLVKQVPIGQGKDLVTSVGRWTILLQIALVHSKHRPKVCATTVGGQDTDKGIVLTLLGKQGMHRSSRPGDVSSPSLLLTLGLLEMLCRVRICSFCVV